MVACLIGPSPRLAELAGQFSPIVERVSEDIVVFSVDGLRSLFGDAHQLASEIARGAAEMDVIASLAIAANKSTAMLMARHRPGVTLVEPGREAAALASISVEALLLTSDVFSTLLRWGIHTLGDLAALPESGVTERLGTAGARLRRVALGQGGDILTLIRALPDYALYREMDDAIEGLEPLLFVISAHLHEIAQSLQRNGRAAGGVSLALTLEDGEIFTRTIMLAVATRDPLVLLKQLQLSLEAQPPGSGILAVRTVVIPADSRVTQGGLFRPSAPEPDKLQTLLARLGALAGTGKVGSPEILDTHRPDAFKMRGCAFKPSNPADASRKQLRVAFRHFRPPVEARVTMRSQAPLRIHSARVTGDILHAAGPWRTSGGILAGSSWERDEWDIVVEDDGVYRVFLTTNRLTTDRRWFVCGSYD